MNPNVSHFTNRIMGDISELFDVGEAQPPPLLPTTEVNPVRDSYVVKSFAVPRTAAHLPPELEDDDDDGPVPMEID